MRTNKKFYMMYNLIERISYHNQTDDDIELLIKKFIRNRTKYSQLLRILHRETFVDITESDVNFISMGFGWKNGEFWNEILEREDVYDKVTDRYESSRIIPSIN